MPPQTPPAAAPAPDEIQQKRDLQREQTASKENQGEAESSDENTENEEPEEEAKPAEETGEEGGEGAQDKARQQMPASLAKTLLRIPKKTCSSIVGLIGTIIRIIFDVKAASMIYDAIDKMIGEENTDRAFCCALGCNCLMQLAIIFGPIIIATLIVIKILEAVS